MSKFATYISILRIWAFSFGCLLGWGAFVMPATTFLPSAGPLGSAVAMTLVIFIMGLIAVNYHYMIGKYPDSGGSFTYTFKEFGPDHAFLCGWFLWIVYLAIFWANLTALPILVKHIFGPIFQFGYHYTVYGYEVYVGEVFFTLSMLALVGLLSAYLPRLTIAINCICALVTFFGVLFVFSWVASYSGLACLDPPFAVDARTHWHQIFNILALAPWAFAGFEAISLMDKENNFPFRYTHWIMLAAICCGALIYSLLVWIAASPTPNSSGNWLVMLQNFPKAEGLAKLPTLNHAKEILGSGGLTCLALAAFGACITGILGFLNAAARLSRSMSSMGFLPAFLLKPHKNPLRNAIFFAIAISVFIPFGRSAISSMVDIATIGSTLAYAYTSAAAFRKASQENCLLYKITGVVGVIVSVFLTIFMLTPNMWTISSLTAGSFLILALVTVIGIFVFMLVFKRDQENKVGRSSEVWLCMLFLIFFSSLMWTRQMNHEKTQEVINMYHADSQKLDIQSRENREKLLEQKHSSKEEIASLNKSINNSSTIELIFVIIVLSVSMVFVIYSKMYKKQKKLEIEKLRVDEINKSKTTFLSNMSHDIRTPMNAILGFTNLALADDVSREKMVEYLKKIKLSSVHLLSLINDVLEMSRIESGKIELQETVIHIPEILHDLCTIIVGQAEAKHHELSFNAMNIKNENIHCDKLRLNQVLLNLLSNAIKYTQSGGKIAVGIAQLSDPKDGFAEYEIRVKDNGMGMSPEFATKIFDAFERERNSTISGIQGTGLGMAITKRIVEIMHGSIDLETAPGQGSEFIVKIKFRVAEGDKVNYMIPELKNVYALVVDDDYTTCDSITNMLSEFGIPSQWTLSGGEAILRTKKALTDNKQFSLFLIDWKLPDRSGIDVARAIRDISGENAPIILMTAYDWVNVKEEARQAGVNEFCNKPVFTSELYQAICKVLLDTTEKMPSSQNDNLESFDLHGKRVLLVDDMEINREIAVTILSMNGMEVEEACDGEEAVARIAEVEPGYYDCVLMDIQMPKMDGYAATRAIRNLEDQTRGSVPIIAMTANAFDEDKKAALDAGMNEHIAKPIDVMKLLEALSNIVRSKKSAQ